MKNGKKYLLHGRSTSGFINTSLGIPSEKITVAIFTNTTYGGLKRKALFLASSYSDGNIPMPAEIVLVKYIEIME